MRLDNVLFRAGFTTTIPEARQLINHGHILVNNHKVTIPSYTCVNQDEIKINILRSKRDNLNIKKVKKITPSYLKVELEEFKISILNNFNYNEVGLKINELLVIEYYSRS